MPVIEDHPPFGLGISARYAGDRGTECQVLEPHDHLHNKQIRSSPARAEDRGKPDRPDVRASADNRRGPLPAPNGGSGSRQGAVGITVGDHERWQGS